MLGGNPAMDYFDKPCNGNVNKVLLLLFSSIHFLCKNMKLKASPNSTHFLLYYSPSIQILPCKMVFVCCFFTGQKKKILKISCVHFSVSLTRLGKNETKDQISSPRNARGRSAN